MTDPATSAPPTAPETPLGAPMSGVEALYRELVQMHRIVERSADPWRWVLSSDAVNLLREYARTVGAAGHLDGDVTAFAELRAEVDMRLVAEWQREYLGVWPS